MRTEFVEFESEILHPLLKMYPKNNRFNIPLWIPDEKETPPKGIVIMINGFLEGMGETKVKRDKSLKLYSSIAEKLCEENIASVFLPMPFHFDRCEDFVDVNLYA